MKETMIEAIKKAGKVVNEERGKIEEVRMKSYKDFVTSVDLKSEEIIVKTIKERFPEHTIYSEEMGTENKSSEYMWIIDPLDGTHNYMFNIPFFGISIALARGKDVLMGAVYLPAFDELFFAEKGRGAFLNGKPINVAPHKLPESLVLYDNQFHNHKDMLPNFAKIAEKVFTTRIMGSAVCDLTSVARGYANARIFHKPKLCDFAAGALIVEEAGGKATDFQGNNWNIETKNLIASNGIIHNDLLQILKIKKY